MGAADPGAGLTVGTLLAFNVAVVLASVGPGPAFLLCTETALRSGRRAGIMCGAGLAVMAGTWTLAALAGLETLFETVPGAYTAMKVGGALLILGFAVVIWRSAEAPAAEGAPRPSKRRAFARGFVLNLGNPKSILFSAGVLLVIFPPGLTKAEMALVAVNHVVAEVVVYATLAVLLNRDRVRRRYMDHKPVINRVMAVVLGGLGARLLVTS